MKIRIALAVLLFSSLVSVPYVFADGSCLTVNNGGTTTRQVCIAPTPSPSTPQPITQQQDNGGQHVYPSSSTNTKTTPNTGPDDWSLLLLAAAGACGVFLRNKAKT